MPLEPNPSRVHVNALLTNAGIAYKNAKMVGETVAPVVTVEKLSDSVPKWNKGDTFRPAAAPVAVGAAAPRGGFDLDAPVDYKCKGYRFAWPLPDKLVDNMDTPIRSGLRVTEKCMDMVQLAHEIDVAGTISATGTWTGITAIDVAGQEWDTPGGGNPFAVFKQARLAVRSSCAMMPNICAMALEVVEALFENPVVIERIKGGATTGQPAVYDLATLQRVFRLPRIVVFESMYNTAAKGLTASLSPVLGDTVFLGYVAETPSLMDPSALYSFQLRNGVKVKTWREEKYEQDVVEAQKWFDNLETATDAAVLITNTLLNG